MVISAFAYWKVFDLVKNYLNSTLSKYIYYVNFQGALPKSSRISIWIRWTGLWVPEPIIIIIALLVGSLNFMMCNFFNIQLWGGGGLIVYLGKNKTKTNKKHSPIP